MVGGVRGMQVVFERQKTSRDRLEIKWDYPRIIEVEHPGDDDGTDGGGTVARARMRALPWKEAIANIAGDDPRPLLVLRECEWCKGTDDALRDERLNSDMTALYSRWFHCVKLPNAVLQADHTFHELFAGEVAPHLFVSSRDGTNLVPMGGRPPRSELLAAMEKVLRLEYRRDPEKAAKEILKLLSHYDHLDSLEREYGDRLELEIEKRGPDSSKVRALRAKLAELEAKREKALAREEAIADLGLIRNG